MDNYDKILRTTKDVFDNDFIRRDMTEKKKRPYKSINITEEDWTMYNEFAISLSADKGERISIPALIKQSVEHYYKSI